MSTKPVFRQWKHETVRTKILSDRHRTNEPALFLSERGSRISARRVEQILEKYLAAAGLSGRGYSPHKLRHTAATLMYQYGGADVRVLKEESLDTRISPPLRSIPMFPASRSNGPLTALRWQR